MLFKNRHERTLTVLDDAHGNEVDIMVMSHVGLDNGTDSHLRFSCDPATADAIASALHVAAAQVRSARGERVEMELVESTTGIDRDYCTINGPTIDECETDYVLIHKADVPRLIAELGAWLAASEAEAMDALDAIAANAYFQPNEFARRKVAALKAKVQP